MTVERTRKPRPPLDPAALERLALRYVERYATTRARLSAYLVRKTRERGWDGAAPPPVEAIAERFAELGYVDDRAFAEARAGSLQRRGYGDRRIADALRAAGIEADEAAEVRGGIADGALDAALRFARRRRIGPFAAEPSDRAAREKAFAAMLRAGHPVGIVRQILSAGPDDFPDSDMA